MERSEVRRSSGFTLIELILVLALLTIAISLTAPSLANFFRGRALDSEARRLLALTHQGQSRAVSEGVPMELWIDASQGLCGLEAEPSYETTDPRAVNINVDPSIQIDVPTRLPAANAALVSENGAVANPALIRHPNLPTIRFLPDGSVSDTSPTTVKLIGRDGYTLMLGLARNGLNYEIQNRNP